MLHNSCEMKSGGGLINEKLLNSSSKSDIDLSFLLHSIYGLDHYPDYLRRWNLQSIDKLESNKINYVSTMYVIVFFV